MRPVWVGLIRKTELLCTGVGRVVIKRLFAWGLSLSDVAVESGMVELFADGAPFSGIRFLLGTEA